MNMKLQKSALAGVGGKFTLAAVAVGFSICMLIKHKR